MKEFVSQNAAASATAPPRLFDGVLAGLTVQADGATGVSWTGARAYRNLLEVLQGIANDTGAMDFDVVGNGAAAYLFTHDVKEGSFILNLAGDLSAGGLALYGGVATAELIRRSISCIKTDKPTAQISVELTAKGLGGISNFLKTTFGKSRKGLYINGEASENSSE